MIELHPCSGSFTAEGDAITGGFDSRFDLEHTSNLWNGTGQNSQRCGGNCTLDDTGQNLYMTCPTTQFVYKVDLTDGTTTRHVDYTGTSPSEYPTGILYDRYNDKLFVTYVRDRSVGTYPTYAGRGGIHRYNSSGSWEATAEWEEGSGTLTCCGVDQMTYEPVSDLIICGGKREGGYLVVWAVDPGFTNGATINVTTASGGVRIYRKTDEFNDWTGSVVVLGDTEILLHYNSAADWFWTDLSVGVGSNTNTAVGGTSSRARRSATYMGETNGVHYIVGALNTSGTSDEFTISGIEYVGSNWDWVYNKTITVPRAKSNDQFAWGSDMWKDTDNELPSVCWAWRTDDSGTTGSMVGRATHPDSLFMAQL